MRLSARFLDLLFYWTALLILYLHCTNRFNGSSGVQGGYFTPWVLGGVPLSRAEPSMASLRSLSGVHYCGGTLIHPRVVLTAAHCIKDRNRPIDVDIGRLKRVGRDTATFASFRTVDIIVHERYNSTSYDNDIALLELNEPCLFTRMPLASCDNCFEDEGGCQVRILGWGNTEKGYFSSTLREANTTSVARSECEKLIGASRVTSRMICAGDSGGKIDACQGDSGGPLIQNRKQVGIISFGIGCGEPQTPGVYTSIPKLRPWIDSKLAKYESIPTFPHLLQEALSKNVTVPLSLYAAQNLHSKLETIADRCP